MPNEDAIDRAPRPSGTGGPASRTRHSRLRRIWQIGLEFSKFGLWVAWHRGLMRCDTHPVAERFVLVLQRLGTTFVKLGQHLSLRADLLPEDAQHVLARLQTHAAPFPAEDAVREIESAFGGPWQRAFARLEMAPLAAASIAQIHRATLPDGREVIVKIRRPGAAEQAQADMRILRAIARTVNRVVPPLRRWGLVAVVDEIAANLDLEMDLARESRFVRRFADAWRGSAEIDIPDVVDGLCTPTVMVQRFSSGTLLDELPPEARAPAAGRLVDSYVTQIFRDGLFHGDPHPGNIFAMADGRLCLHDFGIVGRVDRRMRWALAAFALAFVEQDADWVVDAWMDLGLVGAHADRAAFAPAARALLAEFAERPLSDWSLSSAFGRLVAAGRFADVRLPRDLLVLTRTVLLLEGTVQALAPDFSVFEAVSRHASSGMFDNPAVTPTSKRLQYELGSLAGEMPSVLARHVHEAIGRQPIPGPATATGGRSRVDVDGASRRVALAVVAAGLYVASSLLVQGGGAEPHWAGMPPLALAGYLLAIRFTFSAVRGAA